MFEKAVRMKLRFNYKGLLSVEDLWDLSVNELDKIYQKLRKEQKDLNEDSLLEKQTKESEILNLKVDLIKYIVKAKTDEVERGKERLARKLQREKIAAIIAKKQDEGLENMSLEDLKKAFEDLS